MYVFRLIYLDKSEKPVLNSQNKLYIQVEQFDMDQPVYLKRIIVSVLAGLVLVSVPLLQVW
jgi:hypothetical protein